MQLLFLLVALLVARAREFDLLASGSFPAPALELAAAMLAAGVVVRRVHWAHTPVRLKRRLLLTRPQEAGELVPWAGPSVVAAVVEEVVYRGVMVWLLAPVLGAWWPAVIVCVAAFAIAHVAQGWQRVLVIALFAMGAHGLAIATFSQHAVPPTFPFARLVAPPSEVYARRESGKSECE